MFLNNECLFISLQRLLSRPVSSQVHFLFVIRIVDCLMGGSVCISCPVVSLKIFNKGLLGKHNIQGGLLVPRQ